MLVFLPSLAVALDFSDYDAVCTETAEARPPSDADEFHRICTCAYDVISKELGPELTLTYARFELGDDTLENMLPANVTTEAFFELLGEIGPSIDASCANS
jgi:hypothetical protein